MRSRELKSKAKMILALFINNVGHLSINIIDQYLVDTIHPLEITRVLGGRNDVNLVPPFCTRRWYKAKEDPIASPSGLRCVIMMSFGIDNKYFKFSISSIAFSKESAKLEKIIK